MTTTTTVSGRAWKLILEAARKIVEHPNTKTPLACFKEMDLVSLLYGIEREITDLNGRTEIFPEDIVDVQSYRYLTLEDLIPFVKAALGS
ncbi:MAG: hypothetical protein AAB524_02440 [Patescibacteria group bacterium]